MGEGLSARERSERLRERVRGGWSGSKTVCMPPYRVLQLPGRVQHLIIREPDNRPAKGLERLLSASVSFHHFVQQVNRAIDLDDQSKPVTGEVGVVGANGMLALELVAVELAAAQT